MRKSKYYKQLEEAIFMMSWKLEEEESKEEKGNLRIKVLLKKNIQKLNKELLEKPSSRRKKRKNTIYEVEPDENFSEKPEEKITRNTEDLRSE